MPGRRGGIEVSVVLAPACFSAFLLLLGCSGNAAKAKADSPPAKGKPVLVSAFTVTPREVRRTVEAVGSLFPFDEVVVSSEVDGRADQVLADVGDHVTKGQTLVEVLPIEFKLAADQQDAILEQAKAKLGLTDSDADAKDPTQTAAVKKAAADLANAEQKYRRTRELSRQGVFSKQNLDEDEAIFKAAQATYDLAVQDVRNLQAAIKSVAQKLQQIGSPGIIARFLREPLFLLPSGPRLAQQEATTLG